MWKQVLTIFLNLSFILSDSFTDYNDYFFDINEFLDTKCDYVKEALCGDICIVRGANCFCGNEVFNVNIDQKQCCMNNSTYVCTRESEHGVCPQGTVLRYAAHDHQ